MLLSNVDGTFHNIFLNTHGRLMTSEMSLNIFYILHRWSIRINSLWLMLKSIQVYKNVSDRLRRLWY